MPGKLHEKKIIRDIKIHAPLNFFLGIEHGLMP